MQRDGPLAIEEPNFMYFFKLQVTSNSTFFNTSCLRNFMSFLLQTFRSHWLLQFLG